MPEDSNKTLYVNIRWENVSSRRYYVCFLENDLLGDLLLTVVHGGLGSPQGQVRKSSVFSLDEAHFKLRKIAKLRKQHGYQLVYQQSMPDIFVL